MHAILDAMQWAFGVLLLLAALFPPVASALVQPTVTLSSRENPIAAGKSNFLIARVQGGSGAAPLPRGTVTFTDALTSTRLCVANLSTGSIGNNTSETACAFPSTASVGNHTIFIAYSGDSFYFSGGAPGLVQVVVPSYTVKAVSNGGGAIDPAQYTFVHRGDTVQFQVSPSPGFHVVSVVGDNCGGVLAPINIGGNIYRFSSDGIQFNCTLRASFSNTYQVTMVADTGGRISPTGAQNINAGAATTVTVTPNIGFRLTNVNGCGVAFFGGTAITGPTTWTTAPITSDCRVEAFFTALPTFTVNATASAGGNINPATRAVPQGTFGAFTVTPNTGFVINAVSGCAGSLSGNTYTTSAINAACNISATFRTALAEPPAVATTQMIEFLHPGLNYYFMTSKLNEISLLDRTPPFVRTGQSFLVYPNAVAGTRSITRLYFNKVALAGLRDGHFYTLVEAELIALLALNPANVPAPKLPFSEGTDSFAVLPLVEGVGGSCAASLVPVLRLFRGNAQFPDDPNHRFTTSTAIYNSFVAQGWDGEGVKFCVPAP